MKDITFYSAQNITDNKSVTAAKINYILEICRETKALGQIVREDGNLG